MMEAGTKVVAKVEVAGRVRYWICFETRTSVIS